jgi:hypothetical protein
MVIDWQDITAWAAVAAAMAWLLRGGRRWLRGTDAAGCPSCAGCAARGQAEAAKLIEIQPIDKS